MPGGCIGIAETITGLVAYIGWVAACACGGTGDIIGMPGGRPGIPLGCGGPLPCMVGGGGGYIGIVPAGGYGMSCGPYGEDIGRIIPGGPLGGGGTAIHIGAGG